MKNCLDVPFLPFELLIEILSRLPVKTLIRFACASKSWKSLIIDDPSFVKLHLSRSPKNTQIILTIDGDSIDYEKKDALVVPCSVRCLVEDPLFVINDEECYHLKDNHLVIGSCNGLACLGNFYDVGPNGEFWVQLWNPATHLRSKKSPTFHMDMRTSVYAPWCKMNCGFGFDNSRETYKVVVVHWNCTKRKMETMVYCMGDICWRNILSNPCSPLLLKQIEGQFVGGCVNWLALKKNGPHYQWDEVTLQQLTIASLDMCTEVYRYLSLPEGVSEVPHFEPNLGVLGNHMCLFHDHNKTHFVVWKMVKYGVRESWTRLVNVIYEHLRCDGMLFHALPMCLSEDGDTILLARTQNLEFIKYNIRDQNAEYIQTPNKEVWLKANGYVPSLVSPGEDLEDG